MANNSLTITYSSPRSARNSTQQMTPKNSRRVTKCEQMFRSFTLKGKLGETEGSATAHVCPESQLKCVSAVEHGIFLSVGFLTHLRMQGEDHFRASGVRFLGSR